MTTTPAVRRKLLLGGADQVVSSFGNALVVFLVARVAAIETLGAYTLVIAAYSIAVGLSRALTNEIISVRFPTGEGLDRRQPLGAALVLGAAGSVVCAAGAVVVDGPLSSGLLGLAGALPLLMVQDASRMILLVSGKPAGALANDLLWTGIACTALAFGIEQSSSVAFVAALWAVPGALAGLVALAQVGVLPSLRGARTWEIAHRDLLRSFALEQALTASSRPLAMALVGLVVGLGGPAALQAALVMFGPVVALHVCVPFVGYPEAARLRAAGHPTFGLGVRIGVVAAGASAAWAVALWVAPSAWIDTAFGDAASIAMPLLFPTALLLATVSANLGALMVLRSAQAVKYSRTLRIVSSVGLVLVSLAGAFINGALGAAWAMALWNAATMLGWWSGARKAVS